MEADEGMDWKWNGMEWNGMEWNGMDGMEWNGRPMESFTCCDRPCFTASLADAITAVWIGDIMTALPRTVYVVGPIRISGWHEVNAREERNRFFCYSLMWQLCVSVGKNS